MSIDSLSFSGENCRFYLEPKGSGSEEWTGRVIGINSTGFNRNVNMARTFGAYLHNDTGFTPATVELSFIYDVDSSTTNPLSVIGSSFGSVRSSVLKEKQPLSFYKLKLEFSDYQVGSFNQIQNADEALKIIFYNTVGLNLSNSVNADGELNGVLTFTVNPFNEIGSSNYLEIEKTTSDTVSNYNGAESTYDTIMGY